MDRKEELIAAVRSAAERLGARSLSLARFQRETGIGSNRVYDAFESWPALCAAAGLVPTARNMRVPEEAIFTALRGAFLAHGGLCTETQFLARSGYSTTLLRRRFTNWPGTLAAFRRWAAVSAPDFPYMEEIAARIGPPGEEPAAAQDVSPVPSWPSHGGRLCGELLGFRALLFAPVNEHGVILLFGMVAAELGYRIETVAPGFPDCTARRHVGGGRWESVRIEFEHRSRSFLDHGHDPKGCEIIVCWEHDWPDCPLEVLELRRYLACPPRRISSPRRSSSRRRSQTKGRVSKVKPRLI